MFSCNLDISCVYSVCKFRNSLLHVYVQIYMAHNLMAHKISETVTVLSVTVIYFEDLLWFSAIKENQLRPVGMC